MLDDLLATQVEARRDAPAADGRFPFVIFSPGGRTPAYIYSITCEFFASHGYVAVALPSLPHREGERWPFDHTGIDLHLRDLEHAINDVHDLPFVDGEHLGLVSWSVGGVSHALYQMQNRNVDAMISLDGATGYAYGLEMIRESIHHDSTAVTIPYLHAHGLAPARYEVEKSFAFYDSLAASDAYLVTFEDLSHPDFLAHHVVELQATGHERAEQVIPGFETLNRVVLLFLDAFLKSDDDARERLAHLDGEPGIAEVARRAR